MALGDGKGRGRAVTGLWVRGRGRAVM